MERSRAETARKNQQENRDSGAHFDNAQNINVENGNVQNSNAENGNVQNSNATENGDIEYSKPKRLRCDFCAQTPR